MVIIGKGDESKWNKKKIKILAFISIFYYLFYLFYMGVIRFFFHPYDWITIVISLPGFYFLLEWFYVALVLRRKKQINRLRDNHIKI